MRRRLSHFILVLAGLFATLPVTAGSLYLPVNLSPEIEARVERLFVVANMPIIKRPIPVKQVQIAIDKAQATDPALAASVRRYLDRYSERVFVTHVSVSASASEGANVVLPNQRGYDSSANYQVSAAGYWVINDLIALNAGGIIGERQDGQKNEFAEGSFVSIGWDWMQADIGMRPHWWGPFTESDMLLSTQASALPSVTVSNPVPLPWLGIQYELFLAEMSESDEILSESRGEERLTGNPRLFGLHFSVTPFAGFALGVNRLMQYGGADRDASLKSMIQAFFNVAENENIGNQGKDFGNQQSSVTARYTFAGRFPMSIYMEYAGEDTSASSDYHLGNTALMFGLHMPKLTETLDLRWEWAEWQNAWYVNSNYNSYTGTHDAMSQFGAILGHWGGEQRNTGRGVAAEAQTLKLIWDIRSGQSLTTTYRSITNNEFDTNYYEPGQALQFEYAHGVGDLIWSLSAGGGTDVYGEHFSLISGSVRW